MLLTCIVAGSGGEIEGRSWWGSEGTSGRGRKVAIMADNAVVAIFQRRSWPVLSGQRFSQEGMVLGGNEKLEWRWTMGASENECKVFLGLGLVVGGMGKGAVSEWVRGC